MAPLLLELSREKGKGLEKREKRKERTLFDVKEQREWERDSVVRGRRGRGRGGGGEGEGRSHRSLNYMHSLVHYPLSGLSQYSILYLLLWRSRSMEKDSYKVGRTARGDELSKGEEGKEGREREVGGDELRWTTLCREETTRREERRREFRVIRCRKESLE